MPYVNSEGPGKRAHPCRLIWAFSVLRHILQYPMILLADNEGLDLPARMHRLIRTCVVRKLYKNPFLAYASYVAAQPQCQLVSLRPITSVLIFTCKLRLHEETDIKPYMAKEQLDMFFFFFLFRLNMCLNIINTYIQTNIYSTQLFLNTLSFEITNSKPISLKD